MAISYTFQDTQIHLFDINIVPDLLLDPAKTIKNPDYQFLAEKTGYDAFQKSGQYLSSPNFVCTQFPAKHQADSTLWRRYAKAPPGEQASAWALQIPLYLRLRHHELTFDAVPEKDRHQVSADSYLMLNSLGWSTHIQIRLRVPLKPTHLVDICSNARGAVYGAEPYRLNGEKMSAKDVFKYYRKKLADDLLSPGTVVNTPVSRLIFIDVLRADGTLTPFTSYPPPLIKLLAKTIDGKEHLVTRIPHNGELMYALSNMWVALIDQDYYNFSICDFNQGVFTFLQREAIQGNKPGGTRCYANNIRDSYWVGYSWLEYSRQVRGQVQKNKRIQELLANGSEAIAYLKENFSNRTSHSFLHRYRPLQSFVPSTDEYPEDAEDTGPDTAVVDF